MTCWWTVGRRCHVTEALTGGVPMLVLPFSTDQFAGAAAVTAAILYGVHMVRVHDVKAMKAVVEVADEIAKARFDAAATVVGTAGSSGFRAGPR